VPDAAELMRRDGVEIEVSRIAPAFGRDGGGLQVLVRALNDWGERVDLTVEAMLEKGYLE
jgi:hypothetical protein